MFSVLRKTKVIFKKLFFFFFESRESREAAKNSQQRYASSQRNRRKYLRTTRTSRSARNSKGYRWILANSLPNLTLPYQLNDSNYLLLYSSKKNPPKKIGTPRAEPDILGSWDDILGVPEFGHIKIQCFRDIRP